MCEMTQGPVWLKQNEQEMRSEEQQVMNGLLGHCRDSGLYAERGLPRGNVI